MDLKAPESILYYKKVNQKNINTEAQRSCRKRIAEIKFLYDFHDKFYLCENKTIFFIIHIPLGESF